MIDQPNNNQLQTNGNTDYRPSKRDRQFKSREENRTRVVWGMTQADFYNDLHNQQILVTTLDGKALAGKLIGVDVFDLILEKPEGERMLLAKGAIKTVRAYREKEKEI